MNLERDPDAMTTEERRLEVAGILAAGLVRRIRQETANSVAGDKSPLASQIVLDLPAETRLSVAQRPAG